MKISARNVFRGRVQSLEPGGVNAEVVVDLGGGDCLVAVVTMESCRELGLAAGRPVVALVKAPWVMLAAGAGGPGLSARNRLAGTVESVEAGVVNAEVRLRLAGGTELAAVVTKEAVRELGLRPGAAATALIKASHVVLGLPPAD